MTDADPGKQCQAGDDRDRGHDEDASVQPGVLLAAVVGITGGGCGVGMPAHGVVLDGGSRR